MAHLGVNIDHVATIRQARQTYEPDPVAAAALATLGGADVITIHLREDRRHIQDRDLTILRQTVPFGLNLELSCEEEIVEIACRERPDQATLVPERREEVTTEGGLDVAGDPARVRQAVEKLHGESISGQPLCRSRYSANRTVSGPRCRGSRTSYGGLRFGDRRCPDERARTAAGCWQAVYRTWHQTPRRPRF